MMRSLQSGDILKVNSIIWLLLKEKESSLSYEDIQNQQLVSYYKKKAKFGSIETLLFSEQQYI